MKTKSSTRPSKKKPARTTTAAVRGRSAKVTSARTKLKGASAKKPAAVAKAKKPAAVKTPPVDPAKYRQSGAPWWKAFL